MFSKKPAPKAAPASMPTVTEPIVPAKEGAASTASTASIAEEEMDRDLALAIEASKADMHANMNGQPPSSQSPLKPAEKRRASASASPVKPVKRGKTGALATTTKGNKGQQSLKGFFQTTSKSADAVPSDESSFTTTDSSSQTTTVMPPPSPRPTAAEPFDPDPRASQEASKEGWTKLFSKKVAPRCEHGEPCISLTTKKPGVNCGRQFWICPRPIGPSGHKEVGTQWRCGTFIWCSDWKGS